MQPLDPFLGLDKRRQGRRRRVLGPDGDGVGALGRAVVDHQLRDVLADPIRHQGRPRRARIGQGRRAADRGLEQRPLEGQRVAVRVARAATVEGDRPASRHRLIRAGGGHWRAVVGGEEDGVGRAAAPVVVDHQPGGVAAGPVDGEVGLDRVGSESAAPLSLGPCRVQV